jgi:hypothetical protein
MSLGQEQEQFARQLVQLIQYIWDAGDSVRIGEVQRPVEMQAIYVKTGRSKTMDSEHIKKCAADLVVLRRGVVLDREGMKPYGDFWEGLDIKNRWGGNWRGLVDSGKSHFVDTPHFERKTAG